ncbi:MAG: transcriptional regulator [Candidatus Hodarchaeales archaeon]
MTRREDIVSFLEKRPATIDDLSYIFEIPKNTVVSDIEHIFRSLKRRNKKLLIKPAYCLNSDCNFIFSAKRKRISDPGKCPNCHSERINHQLFKII